MKKQLWTITLLAGAAFSACKDHSAEEQYKADVNNLSMYVDSVYKAEPAFTEDNWTTIDAGYNDRLIKVESSKTDDASAKAKVEETKTKYKAIEGNYKMKIKAAKEAREANDPAVVAEKAMRSLRMEVLGDKFPGNADKWDWVTTENVVSVYENFVDKVRRNGDNFTDAQWTEVKSLWKSLNARKDEIDKNMSGKDNAKVAGLRIAFTAVKSVSKPLSDIKGKD